MIQTRNLKLPAVVIFLGESLFPSKMEFKSRCNYFGSPLASGLTVSASDFGSKGTGFESRAKLILPTIS